MKDCLDSWAVMAWLQDEEPATSRLEAVWADRPVMSWINAGEVFYTVARRAGTSKAQGVLADLRGLVEMEIPSPQRVVQAATIKAANRLSYADAFAVATAVAHRAVLLTGDPEIIGGDPAWRVEDLRPLSRT